MTIEFLLIFTSNLYCRFNSKVKNPQVHCLVELGCPGVALRFGGHFALLVRQMWSNQMDFHEWLECAGARNLPAEIVGSNH